jgi:hypothetical protein
VIALTIERGEPISGTLSEPGSSFVASNLAYGSHTFQAMVKP